MVAGNRTNAARVTYLVALLAVFVWLFAVLTDAHAAIQPRSYVQLAKLETIRSVSQNYPPEAVYSEYDPETGLATFYCPSIGDYDLSGEVGIPDITPIANHYLALTFDEIGDDFYESWIDGDGNGEVAIPDISLIGVFYLDSIVGYRILTSSYEGFIGPGPQPPISYGVSVNEPSISLYQFAAHPRTLSEARDRLETKIYGSLFTPSYVDAFNRRLERGASALPPDVEEIAYIDASTIPLEPWAKVTLPLPGGAKRYIAVQAVLKLMGEGSIGNVVDVGAQ